MICTQCHIPGYVETDSGLCQSCDRAAREQEGKGDGDVERLTKERDGIAAVLVAEQGCRRDALEKLSTSSAEVERLRGLLKRWLKWLDVQSQEPVERVADDTRAALAGEVERKGDEENEDRASH